MLRIAVIGGDGIGPEVCEQGLRCLESLARTLPIDYRVTHLPYGGQRYLATGTVLTDQEVADLKANYDAIYLGAVGRPDVPPGVLERGLLLRLRFELGLYVNLRPVKLYPGVSTPLAGKTPNDIDFIVVRENTEDLYCGAGGFLHKGTPHEVATQEMLATRMGVERCLRYAFELCRQRDRQRKLTLVGKTNVLTYVHDLWMRAFEQVGREYPDVTRQYHHVDACCMYMVVKPEQYDVIVTTNMFGDIITDLGAAIAGGMGVAASGNLNPTPHLGGGPSMFEPVHGSAPDIAGQGKANPIAAILSMAMLLQQTGRVRCDDNLVWAGDRLEAAVARVCPQFAGMQFDRLPMTTSRVADLVLEELKR
jgi:3-isopropylmalate dehydrogenase